MSGENEAGETPVTPVSTGSGGQVAPAVDEDQDEDAGIDQNDLARSALSQAQGLGRPIRRRRKRDPNGRRGGYSGAGPDDRDPAPIGGVLSGLFAERGWQRPVTEARVFADWPGLVGDDIARHCQPVTLRDGELRLAAETTAWATQLRMMSSTLLARLVAELGPDVVVRLQITGPVGPTWKHGGWSVRGARGPRDTYG